MASNFSTLQPTGTTPAGIPVFTFGDIEFVKVPAGTFLMGSKNDNVYASSDEKPQHTVDIPYDYWMARFPLTNEQYAGYVKAKCRNHPVSDWQEKKDHPVGNVSWWDAMVYCQWLNGLIEGKLPQESSLRLPTEAEWEKAARSEQGNEWPWGNEFDKNKCNGEEVAKIGTTRVGLYSPQGDSPFGCADMAGKFWEWTHSLFKPYPYRAEDGHENEKCAEARVARGGSFSNCQGNTRCAYRLKVIPGSRLAYRGFRLVVAPNPP